MVDAELDDDRLPPWSSGVVDGPDELDCGDDERELVVLALLSSDPDRPP